MEGKTKTSPLSACCVPVRKACCAHAVCTGCCHKVLMVPELLAEFCPSHSLCCPTWAPEGPADQTAAAFTALYARLSAGSTTDTKQASQLCWWLKGF